MVHVVSKQTHPSITRKRNGEGLREEPNLGNLPDEGGHGANSSFVFSATHVYLKWSLF